MSLHNQILAYCLSMLLFGVIGYATIGHIRSNVSNYDNLRYEVAQTSHHALSLLLSVERLTYQRTTQQALADARKLHNELASDLVSIKVAQELCVALPALSGKLSDRLQEADRLCKLFNERAKQLYTSPLRREDELLASAKEAIRDMEAQQPEIALLLDEADQLCQQAISIEQDKQSVLLVLFGAMGIGLVGFGYSALRFKVIAHIEQLPQLFGRARQGEFPATQKPYTPKEIKLLQQEAQHIHAFLANAVSAMQAIVLGKKPIEEVPSDHFGRALKHLQDKMVGMDSQMHERAWIDEGIAQVQELTARKDWEAMEDMLFECLRSMVKRVGANQGAIFLAAPDSTLTLAATYAYGKRRHKEKTIAFGEGIAGQCAIEQVPIHLDSLPQGYTAITSGLGEATPSHLLAMPMRNGQELGGVAELASFHAFEASAVRFIELVLQIMTVQVARMQLELQVVRTTAEITSTQVEADKQMRIMRERVEVLESLGKEMSEAQFELKIREYRMSTLLESLQDGVFAIDLDGNLLHCNQAFANYIADRGGHFTAGLPVRQLLQTDDWRSWEPIIADALNGIPTEVVRRVTLLPPFENAHWIIRGMPMYNPLGQLEGASVIMSNVSSLYATAP